MNKKDFHIWTELPKEYRGKNGALQLIIDLTHDHSGYIDARNLMDLIDEIRDIAKLGLKEKK